MSRLNDELPLVVTTLSVEGMTCGACTSAVEGGFKDVPGVSKFSVSLLSERAVVEHDPATISPEKIAEIIEDRGLAPVFLRPSTPCRRVRQRISTSVHPVNRSF